MNKINWNVITLTISRGRIQVTCWDLLMCADDKECTMEDPCSIVPSLFWTPCITSVLLHESNFIKAIWIVQHPCPALWGVIQHSFSHLLPYFHMKVRVAVYISWYHMETTMAISRYPPGWPPPWKILKLHKTWFESSVLCYWPQLIPGMLQSHCHVCFDSPHWVHGFFQSQWVGILMELGSLTLQKFTVREGKELLRMRDPRTGQNGSGKKRWLRWGVWGSWLIWGVFHELVPVSVRISHGCYHFFSPRVSYHQLKMIIIDMVDEIEINFLWFPLIEVASPVKHRLATLWVSA